MTNKWMRTFAYVHLLAVCVFFVQHAESADNRGILSIKMNEKVCYQARDRLLRLGIPREAVHFAMMTTEQSKAPFTWTSYPGSLQCTRILPLYLAIPTSGGAHGGSKKCALNEARSITPIGCFPWDKEDRSSLETFDNVPDFANLIKNRGGLTINLPDPSPEKCERLCGNYKYFGLRYDKNGQNESAICWCTSAEAMRRVVDAFQKLKEPQDRIFKSCHMQCSACKAQPKKVHTLCGSRTHTVVYQRKIDRMMVALDMTYSMSRTIHGEPSSFKLRWGKKVLKCVLEKKQRIVGGTSVHKIGTRKDSALMYSYTDNFTLQEVDNAWNPQYDRTFLWEYLYHQLKGLNASKVNHGQLEVVIFSDGADNGSEAFLTGADAFRNMVDELAKLTPPVLPRFRIVCLDGDRGCEGYEEFAKHTGGSFANFISAYSFTYNNEEYKKFCGEATASFVDPMTCARANFTCSQNSHKKVDAECDGTKVTDCTQASCCELTEKRLCETADCNAGHMLKSSPTECISSKTAPFKAKCSSAVCCDLPACAASVCSETFVLKTPIPHCSNLTGSTPCTNKHCCATAPVGGGGSKPGGGDSGDGDSQPDGADGSGKEPNVQDNDDTDSNLLAPLLIAAAALLLCCCLLVCFVLTKKKKNQSDAALEEQYARSDSGNPADGFLSGPGFDGLAPLSARAETRERREQPEETPRASVPQTRRSGLLDDVGRVSTSSEMRGRKTARSRLSPIDGEPASVSDENASPSPSGQKTAKTSETAKTLKTRESGSLVVSPMPESRASRTSRRSKHRPTRT